MAFPSAVVPELPQPSCQAVPFCCVLRINLSHSPGVPLALFYPPSDEHRLILHILLSQKEVEFKGIESKDSLSLHAFGLQFGHGKGISWK